MVQSQNFECPICSVVFLLNVNEGVSPCVQADLKSVWWVDPVSSRRRHDDLRGRWSMHLYRSISASSFISFRSPSLTFTRSPPPIRPAKNIPSSAEQRGRVREVQFLPLIKAPSPSPLPSLSLSSHPTPTRSLDKSALVFVVNGKWLCHRLRERKSARG